MHGIGNALFEHMRHDEAGQLLTATCGLPALPGAAEMPDIEIHHIETPSPAQSDRRQGRRARAARYPRRPA